MPTITLPDDTYELLARKAAAVGVSPGEFIALALSTDATLAARPQQPLEGDAWWAAFHEFNRVIQTTAGEYPPGFELDVSREAMYPDPNGDGR